MSYDSTLHQKQREAFLKKQQGSSHPLKPLTHYYKRGNQKNKELGERLLEKGKVGCLILAGGQASRLGSSDPKGMTPVSLIKHKSLFQIFFEKTLAASQKFQTPLHLAVMTSPLNHGPSQAYLEQHHRFGLSASQVDLFPQKMLPYLDAEGNWALDASGKIIEGPDGNGGCFNAFIESGVGAKWQKAGIEIVNVVLIDNPLADPFDAELFGFHETHRCDITLKGIFRTDLQEKVGIVGSEEGKIKVIEYSEFFYMHRLSPFPCGGQNRHILQE